MPDWVLDTVGSALYNAALAMPRTSGASVGAQVAQLVEHATENRSVGGSIPPLGTITPFATGRLHPLRSRCQIGSVNQFLDRPLFPARLRAGPDRLDDVVPMQ